MKNLLFFLLVILSLTTSCVHQTHNKNGAVENLTKVFTTADCLKTAVIVYTNDFKVDTIVSCNKIIINSSNTETGVNGKIHTIKWNTYEEDDCITIFDTMNYIHCYQIKNIAAVTVQLK